MFQVNRLLRVIALPAVALVYLPLATAQHGDHDDETGDDASRLTDEYIPPQTSTFPERPAPLFEWGNGFLEPGELKEPIRLPTGAIWSPNLIVWGTARSGLAGRSNNNDNAGEWANRLDLFAQARLSPTERFVIGLRPFDKNGVFSGYDFDGENTTDGFNLDVQTLFFEGDFGEIFPKLDREDSRALDFGFGIGRQPVNFQEGILINDVVDAITITRNSLRFGGLSNFRATALFAWDEIEPAGQGEDPEGGMLGVLTASDFTDSYVEVDLLTTFSDNPAIGDGLYAGVGATQRFGGMASTFRANASQALDDNSTAIDNGLLLTSVLSWVPHETHDNLYVGSFLGIDNFTSASRGPATPGPLANIGILFAATGLGTVGSPISPQGADVIGGSVGYQQIMHGGRSQIIYEAGLRLATDDRDDNTIAVGARFRKAIGQRMVLTLDAFAGNDSIDDTFIGGRVEISWNF
jgi:hypothetical protein